MTEAQTEDPTVTDDGDGGSKELDDGEVLEAANQNLQEAARSLINVPLLDNSSWDMRFARATAFATIATAQAQLATALILRRTHPATTVTGGN